MLNRKNEAPNPAETEKSFQRSRNMIIALVIAIAVWVIVVNVVNPEITVTVSDVPVSFVGESYLREKGFVIVGKEELPDFSLRVKGTRRDLLNGMKRISVEVDVSDIDKKGEVVVGTRVNVPDRLSIQKQGFSDVRLAVETRYDKQIPVLVEQTGDADLKAEGKIASSVPETEEITVSGSVADVDNIKACIVTVDVSRLRSDGRSMHEYRLVDRDGKPLDGESSVYCESSVVAVNNVIYDRHTLDVGVEVNSLLSREFKVEYNIKNISVPVLEIGAAPGAEVPHRLTAIIPDKEYESGKQTVELEIKPEEGLYIPRTPITLEVNMTPMKEQTAFVRVEIKSIPEGLKADKTEFVKEMKIFVPEDFTEEVTATVDCSEFNAGENEGRIKFDNEYIVAVDSDKLTVTLSQKEKN